MKANRFVILLALSGAISLTTTAQQRAGIDSTGLPGDDFSLQGALEMFRKASSPEEFEKMLNAEDNHVNNLDLNEDGQVDYVRVVDKTDRKTHALVLQVPVSDNESQDIAVIELDKTGDATAVLQIVGDEDIYGEEVIVEPSSDEVGGTSYIDGGYSPVSHGPNAQAVDANRPGVIVNVWMWPAVRYVYAPAYVIWTSPWRWRAYPSWWRPWPRMRWHAFHPYVRPYYDRYAVVRSNRVIVARNIYRPVRMSSVTVTTRHRTAVGNYRATHSRTTVSGPRGNHITRRSTTVSRSHSNAVKSRRTGTRRR